MRNHGIILTLGLLSLLQGLACPAPPESGLRRNVTAPDRDLGEVHSPIDPYSDPFGEFLRQLRSSEDSLHYRLAELAFNGKRFDSALGHHLAVHLPATGTFRDTLVAQRSAIFAQVWPAAAPLEGKKDATARDALAQVATASDSLSQASKPEFAWGMGTSHSRGLFRAGAWQPDGWRGMGFEERYWMYNTFARQSWPLSFRGRGLGLAANVNQGTAGEFSTFDAALEAHVREGILADLSLVLSGGRRKSLEWGAYQSYDLLASKGWYFESVGMGLQAGFSREWNSAGKRMNDNAWVALSRDIRFEGGSSLGISLHGAFDRRDPHYDRITASVLYVDDVAKAHPTHFRARDFRDTLQGNAGNGLEQFSRHAGTLQLATVTPRSYLSLSPALQYGFSLPAGFEAMAGASYAMDAYRESTWDWVPTPDSMDLSTADLVGLAFNRADGHYYAAALAEENGELRESYGAVPLQQRKAKRLDRRLGLNASVWRSLPHGYTLALDASADFGWSNLSHASPIGSQPWQWGLTFNLSRSSVW